MTTENPPVHWLLVSSPENFETSRARGFDIAGMKSRHRKKVETVRAGDTVFFYCTGLKAIAGLAEVTGPYFEDASHIWESTKVGEEYPFRFPIRPVAIIGAAADYVPVEEFVDALDYPKRWPRENWTLAFQGNVHKLNEHDFAILASAVTDAATGIKSRRWKLKKGTLWRRRPARRHRSAAEAWRTRGSSPTAASR